MVHESNQSLRGRVIEYPHIHIYVGATPSLFYIFFLSIIGYIHVLNCMTYPQSHTRIRLDDYGHAISRTFYIHNQPFIYTVIYKKTACMHAAI